MSTTTILLFAIGVFVLMSIGMILTMIEFNRISDEPSLRKGAGSSKTMSEQKDKEAAKEETDIRIVFSKDDAA